MGVSFSQMIFYSWVPLSLSVGWGKQTHLRDYCLDWGLKPTKNLAECLDPSEHSTCCSQCYHCHAQVPFSKRGHNVSLDLQPLGFLAQILKLDCLIFTEMYRPWILISFHLRVTAIVLLKWWRKWCFFLYSQLLNTTKNSDFLKMNETIISSNDARVLPPL